MRMDDRMSTRRVESLFEVGLLAAVPLAMGLALVAGFGQTALLMLFVVTVVLAMFFAGYEASKPALRQIMPTLVLAALAAAGRILFAAVPDFKPVSAVAIIAGATLGRRNGFMVGALAALTSNFFFGQGMWSPWQMYAWGLMGYLGGVLADAQMFDDPKSGSPRRWALAVCGLASGACMADYQRLRGVGICASAHVAGRVGVCGGVVAVRRRARRGDRGVPRGALRPMDEAHRACGAQIWTARRVTNGARRRACRKSASSRFSLGREWGRKLRR